MAKRWSYKDVCEYLKEYNCEMITLEKDYKNVKENISIKCSCGNVFNRAFNDYKRRNNHMCTKCKSGTHRWKYDEVFNYIESKGALLLSSDYKNSSELLNIKCECGNVFSRNFKNFKDGKNYKCPRCGYHSIPYDEVKMYIESKGCKLVSETYVNNGAKIDVECSCGEIFSVMFREFKYGDKTCCNKCSNSNTYTYQDIKDFIKSKGCTLLSKSYINNSEKLSIKCKCGNIFDRRFNNFKDSQQYYCRECSCGSSKGEMQVESILKVNGVLFEKQFKFDDCRNIKPLPFDFYLPEYNICIEYDGVQHFRPVEAFGGEDEYKIVTFRDSIKNNYCKNNNIKLIRIPYFKYNNIKDILSNELKILMN